MTRTARTARAAPPEAPDGFVPIERTTRFTHDEQGRLVAIDGPREDVADITRLDWDDSSRLLAVHPPARPSLRLDALDALGRPTEIRIARVALSIVRDARGRPTRPVDWSVDGGEGRTGSSPFSDEPFPSDPSSGGDVSRATDLEHDAVGYLRAAIGTDGARFGTDLDGVGHLAAPTAPDGTTVRPLRDARSRPAGLVDARGNATHERRDDFGALVGIVSPDTGTERLERDAAGNLPRRVREDGGTTSYRRDAAGRIAERRTANGEVTTWTYDEALGRLTSVGNESTTERFEHGQLVRHVCEIDSHRFETAYAYDAFGERVKKVVHRRDGPSEITYFLYGGSALVAEADGSGRIDAEYVYLPDGLPGARLDGDRVHAIHTDHRGAPRLASDRDGKIVWRASYTPFGEAEVVADARIDLPIRLPGQYADAESGTHYNYYRDYDPTTGRYLTGDPLGAIDSLGLAAVPLTPLTIGAMLAGTGAAAGWLLAAVEAGMAGGVAAIGAGPVVVTIGVAAVIEKDHRFSNSGRGT